MVNIQTTRFGNLEVPTEEILYFPDGLIGMADNTHWVLVADPENSLVAWLQSMSLAEVAVPTVSPRKFVPHYRVSVNKRQLLPLDLSQTRELFVLAVVNTNEEQWTANLKAPLLIDLENQIGRQVITTDGQPVRYVLPSVSSSLRKSA